MPIYEYDHDSEAPEGCSHRFEAIQGLEAEPLVLCPTCSQACHRVISAFGIVTTERALLNPKNLESKGFTMYKKAGDGVYEKAAGKDGPQVITRDDD